MREENHEKEKGELEGPTKEIAAGVMIGPLVPLDTDDNGLCDSQWGSNKCPNPAEFILFNLDNAGFAVMCGPHKEGFLAEAGGPGVDVWIYDPDVLRDLTEEARAAGLK